MELLGREDIGSSRYANARYNRAELSRTCTQASCVVRRASCANMRQIPKNRSVTCGFLRLRLVSPSLLDEVAYQRLALIEFVQLDGFDHATAVTHNVPVVAGCFVGGDD